MVESAFDHRAVPGDVAVVPTGVNKVRMRLDGFHRDNRWKVGLVKGQPAVEVVLAGRVARVPAFRGEKGGEPKHTGQNLSSIQGLDKESDLSKVCPVVEGNTGT